MDAPRHNTSATHSLPKGIMIGKEELLFLTIQTAPTAVGQTNGTAVRLKDDKILPQRILANHIALV